jgi:hypothetical protein
MEQGPHFMDEIGLAKGVRIAHWTPGRVRFSFEDSAEAEQFAQAVIDLQGVTFVKSNSLTGSVLVIYNEPVDRRREARPLTLQSPRQTNHTEGAVCVRCQQSVGKAESSEAIRRILTLIASIVTGDVIGVLAWVWAAADAGHVVSPQTSQRQPLSLAA